MSNAELIVYLDRVIIYIVFLSIMNKFQLQCRLANIGDKNCTQHAKLCIPEKKLPVIYWWYTIYACGNCNFELQYRLANIGDLLLVLYTRHCILGKITCNTIYCMVLRIHLFSMVSTFADWTHKVKCSLIFKYKCTWFWYLLMTSLVWVIVA